MTSGFYLCQTFPRQAALFLTLKASTKMRQEVSSDEAISRSLHTNLSIETNSKDPDQAISKGAVLSGSMLFVIETSKTFWQTTKADKLFVIASFRVKIHQA